MPARTTVQGWTDRYATRPRRAERAASGARQQSDAGTTEERMLFGLLMPCPTLAFLGSGIIRKAIAGNIETRKTSEKKEMYATMFVNWYE